MHSLALKSAFSALLCAIALPIAAQVVPGQNDTFSANTQNWSGASPTWISGGGPTGTGDGYLQLHSAGGIGAGSKMAGFNSVQWSGDFSSVAKVNCFFENLGQTELDMRLVFFAQDATQWDSNLIAVLPVASGWRQFTYVIDPTQFTQVAGTTSFGGTVSSVNRMMFRHDPDPASSTGVSIVGTLGIDDIHAVRARFPITAPETPPGPLVPEPATFSALGAGLVLLRRRSKHR